MVAGWWLSTRLGNKQNRRVGWTVPVTHPFYDISPSMLLLMISENLNHPLLELFLLGFSLAQSHLILVAFVLLTMTGCFFLSFEESKA